MTARYDIEKRPDGYWAVVDVTTGATAWVNGILQDRKDFADADDLADLLNFIDSAKPARVN